MTAGPTAVLPGTYDPVTYGHLDTIERASTVFGRLIVAVVRNPPRKKTLFDAAERMSFLVEATKGNASVDVKLFDTLVVDFARKEGAQAIVKGLRAISDFEYEFEMNQLNRKLAPELESFFIMSSPAFSFLSSSGVKEMAAFGGDVGDLVPPAVAERLKEVYSRKRV